METNSDSKTIKINQTIVRFPDIALKTRDAHKLRGYFGNLFKEHSPFLHNHFEDGSFRYAYPLVQYKVIDKIPFLVGINEGSRLLIELFLKIKHMDIENNSYEINSKNLENKIYELNDFSKLHKYRFKTLWIALNQKNYTIYRNFQTKEEKEYFLNKQLRNNILSFYKGIGFRVSKQIMVKGEFKEKLTLFKNKKMLAFEGDFVTNAILPDYAGVGKSTSRGFGTVKKI